MTPVLYSNDSSYYSMIARLVLAEKKCAYTLHNIDIHIKMDQFSPEYVKIQPNMTVPTFVSGNNIIDSSREILFFVNKHFPGPELFPQEKAIAIQESLDLHYAFSIEGLTMGNALRKSPIAKIALKRGLERGTNRCIKLMQEHPEFKTACENRLTLQKERQRLIISKENNFLELKQQAINLCDMLETKLSQHEFVTGDSYTLADIVWTVFLARLHMINFNELVTKRQHLNDYWQRMLARDSYIAAKIHTKIPVRKLLHIIFTLLFRP